jgi:hypothetical protein
MTTSVRLRAYRKLGINGGTSQRVLSNVNAASSLER